MDKILAEAGIKTVAPWYPGAANELDHGAALTVRVIDAEITIRTTAGARRGHYRLLTTLTDASRHPPQPTSSGSTTSAGRSRPPTRS